MNSKEKRKLEIQELTLNGFTQEKISERLGISISTVSRSLKKLRGESNHWLTNLAQKDFASIYKNSLEGLQQDLMHLNELLEKKSIENDIKLQLQIRREITHVRAKYFQYLLQGPMVWSMSLFVERNSHQSKTEPKMEALGGISGL